MKKLKKLILTLCIICLLIPQTTAFAKGPENAIALGVDVSRYNGDIDWAQVAGAGVSFAFVRVGFVRSGIDAKFDVNMRNANANGIRTGVYLYSYADSAAQAAEEAYFVLNAIKDYPVSMPVVYDLEDSTQAGKSKEELAHMANTFCAIIEEAGYYPMVYASKSWFTSKIGPINYDKWVAQWYTTCNVDDASIWQFTSSGSLPGVKGRIDLNYAFKDYTSLIIPHGFIERKGFTYFYENWKMKTGWVDFLGNKYHMDPLGRMVTGWLPTADGTFYFHPQGHMALGFTLIDNNVHYFDELGKMATGLTTLSEQIYLFDGNGIMHTGWLNDGVGMRYFQEPTDTSIGGQMAIGLYAIDNKLYYFNEEGHMVIGWQTLGEYDYFFNPADGSLMTGWINDGTGNFYLAPDGHKLIGVQVIEDSIYYLGEDGRMQTGLITIGDNQFFFMPDTGKMVTDFLTLGENTFYFDVNSGAMAKGFVPLEKGIYHFDEVTGVMNTGVNVINEQVYYFNEDGIIQLGFQTIGDNTFYFNPETCAMHTGWLSDGTNWFYFATDGHMYKNVIELIDNVPHSFNENGFATPMQ